MERPIVWSRDSTVEFVLVVEAGTLEYQARLLCESIRVHGGCYRDAPIIAVSPTPGRRPSRDFGSFAERHAVDYLERSLRMECPEYRTTNRIHAAAERADRSRAEVIVVIDSDTIFLREPDFRLDDTDVAVRPVDVKGICTAGEADTYDPYWRSLCDLGGIDYERLPFITPTLDDRCVRASYNGGLVIVRRSSGILQKAADLFGRSVRAGLRPRALGDATLFASTGFVGEIASAYWGSSQATLSVAIWSTTDRVRILEPTYNVPIHLWDQWLARYQNLPLGDLVHVHYHWLCSPDHARSNPLLDGRLPLSPDVRAWIRARVPFPPLQTSSNPLQ
jgi:hypothetical protein